jgi:hypothetical protein
VRKILVVMTAVMMNIKLLLFGDDNDDEEEGGPDVPSTEASIANHCCPPHLQIGVRAHRRQFGLITM